MSHDRGAARPASAEVAVSGLTLGRWDTVERRLRPRLVPNGRAGPISVRPPILPGFGPSPLAIDVGIDVPGGVVRLDDGLVGSWARPSERIWRAATRQVAAMAEPPAGVVQAGAVRLLVVLGDHWVTGLVLCPGRLRRLGRKHGLGHRTGLELRQTMVVVAATERILVVGAVPDDRAMGDGRIERRTVADRAMAVAADLAAAERAGDGGLPLPHVPLLLASEGSFPGRRILE